jgi:predicted DCC family thiol-disulfide oxidoreductase YuxK
LFLGFPGWVFALLTWGALVAEITFLPLSFWRRGRLLAWMGMLGMHLGIIALVDFADLSFGMVMLHLFTFDPAWLPARGDARRPVLLYDGECGLCNWVVRFLLREDGPGRMHFAPLQGESAQAYLQAQGLPVRDFDSLVFVPDWNDPAPGVYRLRTAGICGAADEIGGLWRVLGWTRFLPAALRDGAYKLVARFRYALFGQYRPAPLPDPVWEQRFLAR